MRTATRIRVILLAGAVLAAVGQLAAQDWPQWRGPNRDNHVSGFTVPKAWPKALTKKWVVPVGIGESSPVMVGDRLYVFARQGKDEVIWCLDAASGKEVWKSAYPTPAVKGAASSFPGTRSTPAVGEGKVCTLGVNGVVSCLDAATGKLLWRKEKPRPTFYTSTSPLVVDGKCVVFAGALTAFDLATGEEKWKWSGAEAPYGSPVLLTVDGVKQVVTPATGTLAGVALADGKLLWQVPIGSAYQSNYSTPLIDGQTVIFSEASGGKGKKGGGGAGGGTMALKVEKKGDKFTATQLWKKPISAAGYHAPLYRDGLVFGVNPGLNFFCVDAKTGDTLWTDKGKRGQCGSILDAGSILLSLTSDKYLVAFRPSAKAYEEVAKYQVSDSETWCVPIVAGNRIYVKDKAGNLSLWTVD